MKAIKMTLLAGVFLVATGVAVAQPDGQRPAPRAEVTRDQAAARADEQFARLDGNRDGRVTREEMRERAQSRMAERQERRVERRGQMFDRLDANRDGQISREEFNQRREMRGERGRRGGHARGMRGMRGGPGGTMMGMRGGLGALGADGVVTAEQFRARALERFDRVDSNRDGRISSDERRGSRGRLAPPPPAAD